MGRREERYNRIVGRKLLLPYTRKMSMLVTFLNASISFLVLVIDLGLYSYISVRDMERIIETNWIFSGMKCNPLQGRLLQSARCCFTVPVTAQTAFVGH
jgi:hypothetical protein